MRRVAIVIVTAGALVVALVPSAQAAAPRCHLTGGRVLARSGQAVVMRTRSGYYGCVRGNAPRLLARPRSASHIVLAGRFAAFKQKLNFFSPEYRITVVDLRSGSRRVGYPGSGVLATPILLDALGRAAWIRGGEPARLMKLDFDGQDELDSGGGLAPSALQLTAGGISWRNGDQGRSFTFDLHPPCSLAGSSTLARSAEARVYWRIDRTVVGCSITNGRETELGADDLDNFEYSGGDHVHAAGHYATIESGSGGRNGSNADLKTFDLDSGRIVHRWECCKGTDASVSAVVLAPSGATAWTGWMTPRSSAKTINAVWKSDADGEQIVLDSDSTYNAIDLRNLTLDGSTLTWAHNGEPQHAELH